MIAFPSRLTRFCCSVRAVSFKLYDLGNTGRIEQEEMEQVLIAINETASYFGDPVLKRAQIKVCMPWCSLALLGVPRCAQQRSWHLLQTRRASAPWSARECSRVPLSSYPTYSNVLRHPLTCSQDLVVDIYEHHAGGKRFLDYSSYVKAVADHPVVVQFANGEGTERYSTGMSHR